MGHNSKEKIESEYAHQYTMYFLAKFHENSDERSTKAD